MGFFFGFFFFFLFFSFSFLLAPSLKSGATYLVTMVFVCAYISTLGWLVSWLWPLNNFFFPISKISLDFKNYKMYSEQLWFLEPTSPSPRRGTKQLQLDIFSDPTPHHTSHYLSLTLYVLNNLPLHRLSLSKDTEKLNHRIRWGMTQRW